MEKKKEDYVIALYMRVSLEDPGIKTADQRESHSIVNQRELLRDFVDKRQEFLGCKITEWCDDGYSGTNFRRPAVEKLLKEAEDRRIDCIIVKDFSRFGRDYLTVSDYVEQIFPFLGIRFISVNDDYDSVRDMGTAKGLEMAFRNIAYGWYSRDISEKEKSGKKARAQRGDFLSAFAPIGYQKDKRNKNQLIVEERGADIVRRIFRLAGAGCRVKEIARLLNGEGVPTPSALKREQGQNHPWWTGIHGESLWDISSVTRILRDERYLGKAVYGKKYRLEVGNYKRRTREKGDWVIVPECHEPIVTQEEFQAAQNMLKRYGKVKQRGKGKGIFRGKLHCGICGYALTQEKREAKTMYCCKTRERAGGFYCMKGCISQSELENAVKSIIWIYEEISGEGETWGKRDTEDERVSREAAEEKKQEERRKAYDRACKAIVERKARLYEKMLEGELEREAYIKKRDLLLIEEKELQAERDRLRQKSEIKRNELNETKREEAEDILSYEFVNTLISGIFVYDETTIGIRWKFGIKNKSLFRTSRGRRDTDGGNVD